MFKSIKQLNFPKTPLKRRILYNFHSFLHLSRIDIILAHTIDADGAVILGYHSVASNENKRWIDPSNHIPRDIFEKHMKFLANNRTVISMDTLINSIKEKKPLPGGTTVVSFDDGYLDNLTNATPILKKYNLPATIYLATGYIEREENQWIDQLFTCFNERTKDRLLISEVSEKQIEMNDSASTWTAYSQIAKYLLVSTYKQRTYILASIKKQLVPNYNPPKLTMNWDDVRTLVNNNRNITLGSHTYNHTDISRIVNNKIISEIKISTEDIKRETGQSPVHFSCPYSRTAENLPAILNKLGYLSSVSDSADLLINSKSFPYALGRVTPPVNLSRLAHYTSGNYPGISKLIMRGRY
ncbi:MAG: polysaccharide deacetylase family protein [Spirochaetota bacterium]